MARKIAISLSPVLAILLVMLVTYEHHDTDTGASPTQTQQAASKTAAPPAVTISPADAFKQYAQAVRTEQIASDKRSAFKQKAWDGSVAHNAATSTLNDAYTAMLKEASNAVAVGQADAGLEKVRQAKAAYDVQRKVYKAAAAESQKISDEFDQLIEEHKKAEHELSEAATTFHQATEACTPKNEVAAAEMKYALEYVREAKAANPGNQEIATAAESFEKAYAERVAIEPLWKDYTGVRQSELKWASFAASDAFEKALAKLDDKVPADVTPQEYAALQQLAQASVKADARWDGLIKLCDRSNSALENYFDSLKTIMCLSK